MNVVHDSNSVKLCLNREDEMFRREFETLSL